MSGTRRLPVANKLLTLGYQTTNPKELNEFVQNLDAYLCDIRFRPWSPAPQWRGSALRDLVGADRYVHIKALGNPFYKEGTIALLNWQVGKKLVERALQKKNVILLCGCFDFEQCHRSLAARCLSREFGIEVENLEGFKVKAKAKTSMKAEEVKKAG
jgi:hypothetical protein